jgi:hypothetical protein
MSHFVHIRTQIREREHLTQALRDLHYRFREGQNHVVRGWMGNRETAEIIVDTGSQYDIGFRRQAEEFEIVADWWGVEHQTQIRQQQFVQQVNRQYSYNLIQAQAQEQELLKVSEEEMENGDLVIVFSERV